MKFDSTRNPHLTFILALFLLCGFPIGINAQDTILPNNDRFHLFLLIGQSNMAGRGKVEQQDKTPHPRVLMLNKDASCRPSRSTARIGGQDGCSASCEHRLTVW